MKILIVEDDDNLAISLCKILKQAKYESNRVSDALDALSCVFKEKYDLILMDRKLPQMDGITLTKELRNMGIDIPIIMLTALGEYEQRIEGLDAGADDYVTKPFHIGELLARIRAFERRTQFKDAPLQFGNTIFDAQKMLLCGPNGNLPLTGKLCMLTKLLYEHADQVVTRKTIFTVVWGFGAEVEEAVIDNYIFFLRRDLRKLEANVQILTQHGVGYRLTIQS